MLELMSNGANMRREMPKIVEEAPKGSRKRAQREPKGVKKKTKGAKRGAQIDAGTV